MFSGTGECSVLMDSAHSHFHALHVMSCENCSIFVDVTVVKLELN